MATRVGHLCRSFVVILACAWAGEAAAQSSTIWSFLGIGSAQQSSNPAIAAAAKLKASRVRLAGLDTRLRGHTTAQGRRRQGRRDGRGS